MPRNFVSHFIISLSTIDNGSIYHYLMYAEFRVMSTAYDVENHYILLGLPSYVVILRNNIDDTQISCTPKVKGKGKGKDKISFSKLVSVVVVS